MKFLENRKLYLIGHDRQYVISEESNRTVRTVNQDHYSGGTEL